MADLVQAREDYAENSVEPGTAPDTAAGPDTSTGIGVDTDMETGTGIAQALQVMTRNQTLPMGGPMSGLQRHTRSC
jgi:hypothetical protein